MKKEEKILLFSSKLIFCRNSKKIARIKLNKTPVKLKMEKGKKKAFGLVLPFPCVCTVFGLPLPRKMSPANKNFRFDLEQEGVEERMLSFYRLGWRCFFEKNQGHSHWNYCWERPKLAGLPLQLHTPNQFGNLARIPKS